jgi:hypothetical protein
VKNVKIQNFPYQTQKHHVVDIVTFITLFLQIKLTHTPQKIVHLFQTYTDKTRGKLIMARKTRNAVRFPIPVHLTVESKSKFPYSKGTDIIATVVKHHPNLVTRGRLELMNLYSIFYQVAFQIDCQLLPPTNFETAGSTVTNPFPPPELPELTPNCLVPVIINAVYSKFFFIHFNFQVMPALKENLSMF